MGGLVQQIKAFFQDEDLLDTVLLFLKEHYELALIAFALIFIFLISLSTILERLRRKSWVAFIPIYRFVVLFKALKINPWCVILMLTPGVNLIMRVVFYVVLVKKFNRGYFFVALLTILPIIFLPVLAFGDGRHIHIARKDRTSVDKKRVAKTSKAERKLEKKQLAEKRKSEKRALKKKSEEQFEEPIVTVEEYNRLHAKEQAVAQKTRNISVKSSHNQANVTNKPVQTKEGMPEMRKGPTGRDIDAQVKKVQDEMTEYERLLKAQEAKQRQRELKMGRIKTVAQKPAVNSAARPVSRKTMDIRRPAAKPTGKSQAPKDIRVSIK